ncbi:hypothetical protein B0T17DRAFT_609280 [Bombardia bombarda]|uniref:Uncharacterized protein n=1 Tax=Bombardia bombarda TaxID=252184 RepID=A0AA39WMR8_9PEZI|nr:hypothetical protein B0T17DRAFT_609280 [Bombardia bombarda]
MTNTMDHIRFSTRERPPMEMREKSRAPESFFSRASVQSRTNSVHTEFMETDWEMEDDEIYSDMEDLDGPDDGDTSPRISVGSSGQPSITTLSSYDEVQTPRSVRYRGNGFPFEQDAKQVEGPRGPHLFRSSMSSGQSVEFQHALSLSPITPKDPRQHDHYLQNTVHLTTLPTKKRHTVGPFEFTDEELDTSTLADWTPEMVAQWMLNAGVELVATEKFVENDINGAILITLKFEDLKELGISSFGVRTRVWEEIHSMRNIRQPAPEPETPIEDVPARKVRQETRRQDVGIEQMMPKPHHCSKGENCAKWKRNQRMIEAFKKDHPFVDIDGGIIMVAGDPGNPETAEAIRPGDEMFRPFSDAMPSVVASSDVMGPGNLPPLQYLQEAALREIQARDPQDNIFPQQNAQKPLRSGLRALPKLSIPTQTPPVPRRESSSAHPLSAHPMSARHLTNDPIPSFREMSPSSDEETTPTAVYRFGTPFSEMDVPVTMQSLPPVSRDFSQSVPPDMNYRHNPAPPLRSMSRATIRRPSFPVLPALDENSIVTPIVHKPSRSLSQRAGPRPLQPPPRVQYPWTQADRTTFERAIPPMTRASTAPNGMASINNTGGRISPLSGKPSEDMTGGEAISYQGLMKKRKTKMLRHEWHEHFFTLRGTRLTMHKDAATAANKTLEYIDIDDYAIACSSLASSKLNAAFKAMHIRRSSGDAASSKEDVAAFSFQLIPQDIKGGVRLRKRESTLPGILGGNGGGANASTPNIPGLEGAVNGTGKTHHFAVKGRDERIDWMRELMLAKALKQKGEGFEVSVNGNMI